MIAQSSLKYLNHCKTVSRLSFLQFFHLTKHPHTLLTTKTDTRVHLNIRAQNSLIMRGPLELSRRSFFLSISEVSFNFNSTGVLILSIS